MVFILKHINIIIITLIINLFYVYICIYIERSSVCLAKRLTWQFESYAPIS